MAQAEPFDGKSAPTVRASDVPPRGLVMVIGGVGGLDWCGIALRRLSKTRRLPYEVQIVSWGLGFGRWYADLTNVTNRDTQAARVAERLRLYKARQPGCPIFVVAKSGGAGVAIKGLELLNEDHAVERVVLLAPALSPGYDLTAALRAVRREMVVFWSPLDLVVLGAGTRVFGTIDRVKSVGAGLVGFRVPPVVAGDPNRSADYDKLRQVRWRPGMAASGYFGGHMGPDSPFFLSKYVVPLLRVEPASHC